MKSRADIQYLNMVQNSIIYNNKAIFHITLVLNPQTIIEISRIIEVLRAVETTYNSVNLLNLRKRILYLPPQ